MNEHESRRLHPTAYQPPAYPATPGATVMLEAAANLRIAAARLDMQAAELSAAAGHMSMTALDLRTIAGSLEADD
jgi:hypothetical protein